VREGIESTWSSDGHSSLKSVLGRESRELLVSEDTEAPSSPIPLVFLSLPMALLKLLVKFGILVTVGVDAFTVLLRTSRYAVVSKRRVLAAGGAEELVLTISGMCWLFERYGRIHTFAVCTMHHYPSSLLRRHGGVNERRYESGVIHRCGTGLLVTTQQVVGRRFHLALYRNLELVRDFDDIIVIWTNSHSPSIYS